MYLVFEVVVAMSNLTSLQKLWLFKVSVEAPCSVFKRLCIVCIEMLRMPSNTRLKAQTNLCRELIRNICFRIMNGSTFNFQTRRKSNLAPKLNTRCSQYFSITKLPSSRCEYSDKYIHYISFLSLYQNNFCRSFSGFIPARKSKYKEIL